MQETIVLRVGRVFEQRLSIHISSDDVDLIQSGLLDSLALVELLLELEREFDISLPLRDLDIEDFRTIESIGTFIESLRSTERA